MEQGKLKTLSHWSKTGIKRENFSPAEKRIAKVGLGVTAPVAMLYALHLVFPDAWEIAAAFASTGMLLLLLAATCILAEPDLPNSRRLGHLLFSIHAPDSGRSTSYA